ncbi:hypothetical protein SGFS_063340 [Streptomyces graminofaciens]|jgi:hypothetical protein|uniref:Uncharacterized protein n=1 Tax=Streptomyces graminofaciens TaxID=68212 RepID=A0ABN5VP14_9ACTN|nr:hypothetical protein SGFS_063340 [Streptomyces graminofaciens]
MGPAIQGVDEVEEAGAQRREGVFHAWRYFAVGRPGDQAVLLELSQSEGEHALGDPGDGVSELGVAQRPVVQRADHGQAPLVAEAVEGLPDEVRALDRDLGAPAGKMGGSLLGCCRFQRAHSFQ